MYMCLYSYIVEKAYVYETRMWCGSIVGLSKAYSLFQHIHNSMNGLWQTRTLRIKMHYTLGRMLGRFSVLVRRDGSRCVYYLSYMCLYLYIVEKSIRVYKTRMWCGLIVGLSKAYSLFQHIHNSMNGLLANSHHVRVFCTNGLSPPVLRFVHPTRNLIND